MHPVAAPLVGVWIKSQREDELAVEIFRFFNCANIDHCLLPCLQPVVGGKKLSYIRTWRSKRDPVKGLQTAFHQKPRTKRMKVYILIYIYDI